MSPFVLTALALFVYMNLWFLVAVKKQRADVADIAWGLGFLFVAWVSFFLHGPSQNGLIVNGLVTVWALRLSGHIYLRTTGKKEDFRYVSMKENWGSNAQLRLYLQVFLLQGAILYVVALPVFWIHAYPNVLFGVFEGYALFLWGTGFVVEAVGDYELLAFKADPDNKGKLLSSGMWSISRHPNFFGELLQWWAIWLIALSLPYGYMTAVGPLLLTLLIVFVSGIAPLEKKMQSHPDFAAYAEKTPRLVPIFFLQAITYAIYWIAAIVYGPHGLFMPLLAGWIACFVLHLLLLRRYQARDYNCIQYLAVGALILGVIQQMVVMATGLLAYPDAPLFPPFWLYSLYPLFALILPTCLPFLIGRPLLSFFVGGIGGTFSTYFGATLQSVTITGPIGYTVLFVSWGVFMTLLILLEKYLDHKKRI